MFRTIMDAIFNTLLFLCFISVTCELFKIHVPIFDWMYPEKELEGHPPGTFAHNIRVIVISLCVSYKILTLKKSNENDLK